MVKKSATAQEKASSTQVQLKQLLFVNGANGAGTASLPVPSEDAQSAHPPCTRESRSGVLTATLRKRFRRRCRDRGHRSARRGMPIAQRAGASSSRRGRQRGQAAQHRARSGSRRLALASALRSAEWPVGRWNYPAGWGGLCRLRVRMLHINNIIWEADPT